MSFRMPGDNPEVWSMQPHQILNYGTPGRTLRVHREQRGVHASATSRDAFESVSCRYSSWCPGRLGVEEEDEEPQEDCLEATGWAGVEAHCSQLDASDLHITGIDLTHADDSSPQLKLNLSAPTLPGKQSAEELLLETLANSGSSPPASEGGRLRSDPPQQMLGKLPWKQVQEPGLARGRPQGLRPRRIAFSSFHNMDSLPVLSPSSMDSPGSPSLRPASSSSSSSTSSSARTSFGVSSSSSVCLVSFPQSSSVQSTFSLASSSVSSSEPARLSPRCQALAGFQPLDKVLTPKEGSWAERMELLSGKVRGFTVASSKKVPSGELEALSKNPSMHNVSLLSASTPDLMSAQSSEACISTPIATVASPPDLDSLVIGEIYSSPWPEGPCHSPDAHGPKGNNEGPSRYLWLNEILDGPGQEITQDKVGSRKKLPWFLQKLVST